jgi:hypothetical protein
MKSAPLLAVLGFTTFLAAAADLPEGALPESADAGVGYKTVAAALSSLGQAKGVVFSTVRGWTIVTDEAHFTVWSFAPRSDPSYPSVVKRYVTSALSGSKVHMKILCEANKAACDNLFREFHGMNSRGGGAQLEP